MEEGVFSSKPKEGEPWDVIIIGSGPASLTAAIYTTRGALSTLILGGEKWGGQLMLTTAVDNFPALPGIQGPELMQKMRDHAVSFGAEFFEKNVDRVDFSRLPFEVFSGSERFISKTVIIASGAQTKWLDVPGGRELIGRGVSSCAPCDAPFYKGKRTFVVGGGDSAMEEAVILTKYASIVTMVHRRNEFRASQAMQKKVFGNKKIKVIWDTEVTEVLGKGKVEMLKFKTSLSGEQYQALRKGGFDNLMGKSLEEKDGYLYWIAPADGIFVAIGHSPSTEIFQNQVGLDEKGYVLKVPESGYEMGTSVKGIFVAGDVHDHHYKQAITAAGYGCMAAIDTLKYLESINQ